MSYKAVKIGHSEPLAHCLDERCAKYLKNVEFYEHEILQDNYTQHLEALREAEFVFATWGMIRLKQDEIRKVFPKLKAIFYGAGSVQHFAREFLNEGIIVTSAWASNAIPVAHYTMSVILLSNKAFFKRAREYKSGLPSDLNFSGNVNANVGILGAGMIGRLVIDYLKPFDCNIYVYDPFLKDEAANKLGVIKLEKIEDVFEKCQVVSNHIADLPETIGIIDKKCFDKLSPYGTFINTGRQRQIVDRDLIDFLKKNPKSTAILDVLDTPIEKIPENEYFKLPNTVITPHMAGCQKNEVLLLIENACSEFDRYINNQELKYSVTLKMLETMA